MKVVRDNLKELMGSEESDLNPASKKGQPQVILLAGLQGELWITMTSALLYHNVAICTVLRTVWSSFAYLQADFAQVPFYTMLWRDFRTVRDA